MRRQRRHYDAAVLEAETRICATFCFPFTQTDPVSVAVLQSADKLKPFTPSWGTSYWVLIEDSVTTKCTSSGLGFAGGSASRGM